MSNGLFRLRIRYLKQGRLRFLSHLELTRALERAIRRADLPYAITQGFHPRMKIAFCSALPVGCASNDEYCDVWLDEFIEPDEVIAMLHAVSVASLSPIEVYYVHEKDDSLTVSLALCSYEAICTIPQEITDPVKKLSELMSANFTHGTIEIEKKAKKKKGKFKATTTKSYELDSALFEAPVVTEIKAPINASNEDGKTSDTPNVNTKDNLAKITFGVRVLPDGTLRPDLYLQLASDLFAAMYGQPFTVSLLTRTKQAPE